MVRNAESQWKIGIAFSDAHIKYGDEASIEIIKEYMRDNKKNITHILDLGDGVDNPFMSDFPVNADFNTSAQDEFDMYAEFTKDVHKIAPKANYYIVAGNHDKGRLNKAKNLNRGIASLRNVAYEAVLKEALTNQKVDLSKFTFVDGYKTLKLTRSNNLTITHGDPRLDTNVKGGVTGARRTAEMYPVDGDIYMGHIHTSKTVPRRYPGKHLYSLPMIANIKAMKDVYLSYNPYENGFMIFKYNKEKNLLLHTPVNIVNGTANVDGTIYEYK